MSALISGNYSVLKVLESFWRSCWKEFEGISFTNLAIYAVMCIIVVHLVFYIYARVTGKAISLHREIVWSALLIYIVFIMHITILGREAGSREFVFDTTHLKLYAFSIDQNMTNLLNIVLFIPFGIILAEVMNRKKWGYRILMAGVYCFLFSIVVECTQLLSARGYFELDDIEANFLGGIIGAGIVCVLGKFFSKNKKVDV